MTPSFASRRFAQVRFILVSPSHPGNIGAAARAIKTMGFSRLAVVNPKFANYREHPDAMAFSTDGADVLAASSAHDTLLDALAGVTLALAMTGYDREYGPGFVDLRAGAALAAEQLEQSEAGACEIAFVFGTERSGLTNEEIEQCQYCCAIPANPECPSLNLAQSVQVAAYECQLALRSSSAIDPAQRRFRDDDKAASVEAIEALYAHLQEALVRIGHLDPDEPKHLMARLRRLFARAQLTQVEVNVLRGVTAAIIESRSDRAGRKAR